MLKKLQKSKSEGFTIIEVMIVLAIAGLILLIVFLAVPALQRNSRNTQRKNDVAAIVGALNEFVNNHAGKLPTVTEAAGGGDALSAAKIGYYANDATHIFAASTGTPPTASGTGTPTATNITTDSMTVWIGYKCDDNVVTSGAARSLAVQYVAEASSGNGTILCSQS